MFNRPGDQPRASDYDDDPFGFSHQSWGQFGFSPSTPSSMGPPQSGHAPRQSFSSNSGMDWMPTQSDFNQAGFHQQQQYDDGNAMSMSDNVELDNMSPPQGGGGVGRLVAQS